LLGPDARITNGIFSSVKPEAAIPALFNQCPRELAAWAVSMLGPEPLAAWTHRIAYGSEGYNAIPKYYVECTEDRAVTPYQQRTLRDAAPCDFVMMLDADHSPFLSRPLELASALTNPDDRRCWMSPMEDRVRRIVSEVLQVPVLAVDLDKSFDENGGDSARAVHAILDLEQLTGTSLADVAREGRTLRHLAAHIGVSPK
jgi:acyl carrier protein